MQTRRTPTKIRSRRSQYGERGSEDEIPVRDSEVLHYTPSGQHVRVNKHNLVFQNSRLAVIDKKWADPSRQAHVPPFQEHDRPAMKHEPRSQSFMATGSPGEEKTSPRGDDVKPQGVGLSEFLLNLWQCQRMCDIIIRFGDQEFRAHKIALAAHSDKFTTKYCERLQTTMSEVNLSSASAEAVQRVLSYIYTSELDITMETVESIFVCARQLGIKGAMDKCKLFLLTASSDDAFGVWIVCEKVGILDIASKMEAYICNHFSDVARSQGFLGGRVEHIRYFLNRKCMPEVSELDLFLAAMAWVDFNRQDRAHLAPDLMRCIRLVLISPEDLVTHVEPVQYIFELPQCKQMLYEAFRHHALHFSGSELVDSSMYDSRVPETGANNIDVNNLLKPPEDTRTEPNARRVKPAVQVFKVRDTKGQDVNSRFRNMTVNGPQPLPAPPSPAVVVAIGGLDPCDPSHDESCRKIEEYNIRNNSWHRVTTLPESRHHHAVTSLDGFVYIIGGSSITKDAEEITFPTDVNFRLHYASHSWETIAPLRQPRMYHGACAIEGCIFSMGGSDEYGRCLDTMEFYNVDTDSWEFASPMTSPKLGVACAEMNGMVYVAGGFNENSGHKNVSDEFEIYDPHTNSWSLGPSLPVACCHANMAVVSGNIYVIGGSKLVDEGFIQSLPHVFCWQPNRKEWTLIQSMRTPRHDAGVAVIGSLIYIVGGVCSDEEQAVYETECLDVASLTWVKGQTSIPHAMVGVACCSLLADPSD